VHSKYHNNWSDRVKEAQECLRGAVGGRTDGEKVRCTECEMILSFNQKVESMKNVIYDIINYKHGSLAYVKKRALEALSD